MRTRPIKLFLRLALAIGFLSAVADRFGWWGKDVAVWGTWDNFVGYTQVINPWVPDGAIPALAFIATAAEIIFGLCLLLGFKTELIARWSGFLLLLFGLSMTFSVGLKAALDYSVYTASAAAFALGLLKEKFLEIDTIIRKN